MKRYKAFTLVELLVVIGIISVLIAMLLPALNKAREAAKTVACLSNMRQVTQAIMMYADDNKGYLPPTYLYGQPDPTKAQIVWPALVGAREYGYIKNPDVFICPDRTNMGLQAKATQGMHDSIKQTSSQSARTGMYNSGWVYVSYAANQFGAMPDQSTMGLTPPYKLLKLGTPGFNKADMMILIDGFNPSYAASGYWGVYAGRPGTTVFSPWTHGGGVVNCAFMDGHCASEQASAVGWDYRQKSWITVPSLSALLVSRPWYWGVYDK
jgi:prepilin-type N-terminal cleavage/methylation domain-containing protein/prepilin-type processing-associated H-X9-DG protein